MPFRLSADEVARIRAEEIAKGNMPEVMDLQELAAVLKRSPKKVDQLRIPCAFLGARTKRYLRKSVLQYLENLEEVA